MKKPKHGGARKGSGRPKRYKTKVVRIPEAIEEEVNELKLGYELLYNVEILNSDTKN